MRTMAMCLLVCGELAAQPVGLMLPTEIRVSGMVRDRNMKGIPDVLIAHLGTPRPVLTDKEGRFEFVSRAPAVVFRKVGFESHYLRLKNDTVIDMTLEPSTRRMRSCNSGGSCYSLRGFRSWFCIPRVRGILAARQNADADYGQRQFFLHGAPRRVHIQHAAGPGWGDTFPLDEEVWAAVEFSEVSYIGAEGLPIIDARGRNSKGERWRAVRRPFEAVVYQSTSQAEAERLDAVLDGICLRQQTAAEPR